MQAQNSITAKLQFLAKVKQEYPALYSAAMKRHGFNSAGMGGLGITTEEMIAAQNAGTDFPNPLDMSPSTNTAITSPASASIPWYQSILNSAVNTVQQLAPAYVATKQAQTCISVNASRARQGLAPIDCAAGGLAPTVSVGVSPGLTTMLYVGLGVFAAMFIFSRKKRK